MPCSSPAPDGDEMLPLRAGETDCGGCLPAALAVVYAVLAVVDGAIAAVAFLQVLRINLRNQQLGLTRQKIFHLMIGSSNIGYLIYFVSTILATCKGWLCWSHGCGFILMACPQILFLAAFLLLLSFWVDLCHQANEEDDVDDENILSPLLAKFQAIPGSLHADGRRRFCSFRSIHIGSRQKFVILVVLLTFVFMISFAVLIWAGRGENPIDSPLMARVCMWFITISRKYAIGFTQHQIKTKGMHQQTYINVMGSSDHWQSHGRGVTQKGEIYHWFVV